MLSFYHKYQDPGPYSQNGETGIINEALRRMGITKGHCVEIGANDGYYCSNTAHLIEQGWTATLVEADYELYKTCAQNWSFIGGVKVQCSRVDGNNINAFVDESCDVLSLDTDGADYEIFKGLKAKPKIVIIEIDSSLRPDKGVFNADGAAGYWMQTVAALERGYFVLCHTGNLVLIDQKYGHLFPECAHHPLLEWEWYFRKDWL